MIIISTMYSSMIILAVTVCTVSGQSIAITGTSTLVAPTSELRITCQPSSAGITDINSISLQKNTSSTAYVTLLTVTYIKASSSSVIIWTNTNLQNRQGVSVTGNVDTVSGARLVLVITANNTQCQDEGAYKCVMGVTLSGGSGGLAEAEKYITATVQPTYTNALYVTPFPNVNGQYYSVGTVLTFSCSGTVGSDKRIHTWCYKRDDSTTGYTGYPTVSDIDQNEAGLVVDGCNYRRSSTLTYNVTSADTNTTFMCEPYTGTVCGSSAVGLKSYHSIINYLLITTTPVSVSVQTTDVPPVAVAVKCTDDVTPWIVVAIVFIVMTVALIAAVVFLCLKVRKHKELLHERVDYEGVNSGFSKRDEHVYSTTENYEIPQIQT